MGRFILLDKFLRDSSEVRAYFGVTNITREVLSLSLNAGMFCYTSMSKKTFKESRCYCHGSKQYPT